VEGGQGQLSVLCLRGCGSSAHSVWSRSGRAESVRPGMGRRLRVGTVIKPPKRERAAIATAGPGLFRFPAQPTMLHPDRRSAAQPYLGLGSKSRLRHTAQALLRCFTELHKRDLARSLVNFALLFVLWLLLLALLLPRPQLLARVALPLALLEAALRRGGARSARAARDGARLKGRVRGWEGVKSLRRGHRFASREGIDFLKERASTFLKRGHRLS